jgi:hypothetical protein
MPPLRHQPSRRVLIGIDIALAAWVVAWLVLGIAIGRQVEGLDRLSGTVTDTGRAMETTGAAISALSDVPLVGDRVGNAAQRVQTAGHSAVASGRASRSSVHHLSWMLAVAIAVLPSIAVAGLYLPFRLAQRRPATSTAGDGMRR